MNRENSSNSIELVFWFAYYTLDSPSIRYRALYPLDFVKKEHGIDYRLIIPSYSFKSIVRFLSAYLQALIFKKSKSIVVIQRVRSNFIYSNLLKLLVATRKQYTIYDLDDADYLQHNPRSIYFFARNCQCISAGSSEIANHFRPFNSNVSHISSPILDLGLLKQKRNEVFTVGWVGGYKWGHKKSLNEFFFPALKMLPFYCNVLLLGITDKEDEKEILGEFQECNHIEIEIIKDTEWSNELQLQNAIMQFDVGIATLSNNKVQISKSGIKAKQYMNNGVPVVCNNLPENNNVVQHGYNGFVCNSAEEFAEYIMKLKQMPDEEYQQLCRNSRETVKRYNLSSYIEGFKHLLTQ